MDGVVHVVPRAEYDQFLAKRAGSSGTSALGQEEWQGVCMSCHRLDHKYIGPALGGNALLTQRAGLETLLRNGGAQMPPVGKNWTSHQIDALVAYAKTLGKGGS
jgi:mono/diheme cytochrome c family protein